MAVCFCPHANCITGLKGKCCTSHWPLELDPSNLILPSSKRMPVWLWPQDIWVALRLLGIIFSKSHCPEEFLPNILISSWYIMPVWSPPHDNVMGGWSNNCRISHCKSTFAPISWTEPLLYNMDVCQPPQDIRIGYFLKVNMSIECKNDVRFNRH